MSTALQSLASPAEMLRLIDGAQVLALDLETTGLNPCTDRVRLLAVHDGNRGAILDCFTHDVRPLLPALAGKVLVIHNALFDLSFLWRLGLTDLPETVCTYLLAQLLTAGGGSGGHGFGPCGLAAVAARYLDRALPKGLQASDWSGPLSDEQLAYAARDAEVLLPLVQILQKEIDRAGLERAADVELRALRAFVWLAQSGVPFDRDGWLALADRAAAQKERLEHQLDEQAPGKGGPGLFGPAEYWNWDSPQQVQDVLAQLGFPVSTSRDAQLALIQHPVAQLLREHRHQAQLVKMYGANWLAAATIDGGRVYPGWRQIGAATGRTSCGAPNLQQLPRDEVGGRKVYRCCVKAPPGRVLVQADYSQLQMRIACLLARDDALLEVFLADEDVHTATARSTLGKAHPSKAERQIAKSQNFGLLFGMSAEGLRIYARMTYGVEFTKEEAERHRAAFFRAYPGLARWHLQTQGSRTSQTRSVAGRRRLLHPHTPDTERLNSPVQAIEADGLKLALALLWERRTQCPGAFPVLAVHDEIALECGADQGEQAKAWLTEAMQDGMRGFLDPVPVRVDATIVPTWGD